MRGDKPFADMGAMTPRMKALAQSQDKIGYRNFMEGYISIHFYEIQNFHLAMSSSFINGADWAKQFISKILHITHSQWIFRNFSLHDNRNGYLHKKKADEIALELESLAGLAPEDVPAESRFLLEINFSDLNKSNVETQQYWILAINAALTAQRRQKRGSSTAPLVVGATDGLGCQRCNWIRRVIVRSKSHPAARQRGKHENNWARHPSCSVTPLSCGEYLCWVRRWHTVCDLV